MNPWTLTLTHIKDSVSLCVCERVSESEWDRRTLTNSPNTQTHHVTLHTAFDVEGHYALGIFVSFWWHVWHFHDRWKVLFPGSWKRSTFRSHPSPQRVVCQHKCVTGFLLNFFLLFHRIYFCIFVELNYSFSSYPDPFPSFWKYPSYFLTLSPKEEGKRIGNPTIACRLRPEFVQKLWKSVFSSPHPHSHPHSHDFHNS